MSAPERLEESNLGKYLARLGLIGPSEPLAVEPAGDGNINWVRRARPQGSSRSVVVKQARPALERFPQYRVTTDRILFEARYYATVRPLDREGVCPEILHFDPDARVLVLEDLGAALRLDHALAEGYDARAVARRLGRFLGAVHAATRDAALGPAFPNDEMRRLHGDHIFVLPFRPNDFPLPPAVRARAEAIWRAGELARIAAEAYERYLSPSGALVHGDVQAGNVLLATQGAKLLDAEIAHVGDPAFDVGTLVAHLLLAAAVRGAIERALGAVAAAWEAYCDAHQGAPPPAFSAVARYAGLEVMRRTIGAARVAVVEPVEAALASLAFAEPLVRRPPEGLHELGA